ncbi:polysaccharide deacetylase family protein [Nocardiopsis sp. NPDC007018]|uniref:polysaccharide deacetylase family protein n=1 Tax=Nocardiopsis sp. NPDC007018 TaxID=3155721 RepID=UPI0033F77A77
MHTGIAWDSIGYQVAIVDNHGKSVSPTRRFHANEFDQMIDFVCNNSQEVVVDGTNGLLDSRISELNVTVYRTNQSDPSNLPLLGSLSAETLARSATQDRCLLTKLGLGLGTHAGRDKELAEGFATSMAAVATQPGPARFLRHGPRQKKRIALTFDDGPFPPYTGQILDILEHYSVPATFFCVGLNSIAHPDILIRIREQGSEIGNHTWSHPLLMDLSSRQIAEQLRHTNKAVSSITDGTHPTLFRPTYGILPKGPYKWLSRLNMTTVFWDVNSMDWATPGVDEITQSVLGRVQHGSIVLMHDGGGVRSQTVAALPTIIETLLAREYQLVRVDNLIRDE